MINDHRQLDLCATKNALIFVVQLQQQQQQHSRTRIELYWKISFLNQIFNFGGYFVLAISERCKCDLRGVEEIKYSLIRDRCAKKKKSF